MIPPKAKQLTSYTEYHTTLVLFTAVTTLEKLKQAMAAGTAAMTHMFLELVDQTLIVPQLMSYFTKC